MSLEGQLEDVSLADICQLLALGRKTGCLTITHRAGFGRIFFQDGRVLYAHVLNRPDRLGELLVRNGVITREKLSKAMQGQVQDPEKKLGQILVEQGAVPESELRKYVTLQTSEAVYHLFTWEQGTFHFEPDELPDETGTIQVHLNTESLLLEGARRVDEWSLIEKKIPSLDIIFRLERDPLLEPDLELTPEQETLLPLLDGSRSVAEIVEESGTVEFDVARAIFGLVQAGFVRRVARRAAPRDAPGDQETLQLLRMGAAYEQAGLLEDAVREYRAALERHPGQPTARTRLALLALRAGHPREALDHYSEAPVEARGSYSGLRNRALAMERLGAFEDALSLLDRAVDLRPGDPGVHLARGTVLLRMGNASRARDALARYRSFFPTETPPTPSYFAFATLAAAAEGEWEEAVHLAREGLELHPGKEEGSSPLEVMTRIIASPGEIVDEGGSRLAIAAAGPSTKSQRSSLQGVATGTPAAHGSPAEAPAEGEVIGLEDRFEVIRELERSPSSITYLAREPTLSRFVEVKVPGGRGKEASLAADRILHEARVLSRLQHPYVVPLLGLERTVREPAILVLPYLPGMSLRERIRSGEPMSFSEAGEILRAVAEALHHCHRNGVVHRDVRLDTIRLDPDAGTIRLIGFGRASLDVRSGGEPLPEPEATDPTYLAPEEIGHRPVDGRTDLYRLGLVAWELLSGQELAKAGRLPRKREDFRRELILRLLALRPALPTPFERAIHRALAPEMRERWPGMDSFLAALEPVQPPTATGQTPDTATSAPAPGEPAASARRGSRDPQAVSDAPRTPPRPTQGAPEGALVEGTRVPPASPPRGRVRSPKDTAPTLPGRIREGARSAVVDLAKGFANLGELSLLLLLALLATILLLVLEVYGVVELGRLLPASPFLIVARCPAPRPQAHGNGSVPGSCG